MKSYLKSGIINLILSVVFIIVSFTFPDVRMFVSLSMIYFVCGIALIFKYLYWNKRPEKYNQKIEVENIEFYDERKEMIRGKALRISTFINWGILGTTIFIISLLDQFEVISSEFSRYAIFGIAIYWLISVVIGQVVYKHLSSKY